MNESRNLIQRGRVWRFGDDIPNDGGIMSIEMTRQIIYEPSVLAQHAMRGIDPDFSARAKSGDFIVAGKNFGKGQFHVQGPLGLSGLQVAVLAESMARSFFRMAISIGLPVLPFARGVTEFVNTGDEIELDFRTGRLMNFTTKQSRSFEAIPQELCEIVAAGGERKWLENKAKMVGQRPER